MSILQLSYEQLVFTMSGLIKYCGCTQLKNIHELITDNHELRPSHFLIWQAHLKNLAVGMQQLEWKIATEVPSQLR